MPLAIEALTVTGDPHAWADAGFTVDDDGTCRVGTVRLELTEADGGERGITTWTVAGIDEAGVIDGLHTVDGTRGPAEPADHPNGALRIDHVVVTTPDLDRTLGALRMFGFVPRRTRTAGDVRQTFFRLGEVILEVVGRGAASGTGPARFWGIAVSVADLDATAHLLGDRLGPAKEAVQPGRRIATLRHEAAGISVPVAFMSPDSPEPEGTRPA